MDKSHDLLPILRFNMVLLLLLTALLLLSLFVAWRKMMSRLGLIFVLLVCASCSSADTVPRKLAKMTAN